MSNGGVGAVTVITTNQQRIRTCLKKPTKLDVPDPGYSPAWRGISLREVNQGDITVQGEPLVAEDALLQADLRLKLAKCQPRIAPFCKMGSQTKSCG